MKRLFVLMLSIVMVLTLVACSTNRDDNQGNNQGQATDNGNVSATDYSPAEIEAAIANALGSGYNSTENMSEERVLDKLDKLNIDKVESYVAKETRLQSHDTVMIIKCKEASYADEVVDILNEYYATIINDIRSYPVGVAKTENARIFKADDTVMFIIGGAPAKTEEEEAELAITEYKKIDSAVKGVTGYVPENLAVIKDK